MENEYRFVYAKIPCPHCRGLGFIPGDEEHFRRTFQKNVLHLCPTCFGHRWIGGTVSFQTALENEYDFEELTRNWEEMKK